MGRYAIARVDNNQPRLVSFMRALGALVLPLHTVGNGCPDLLIGHRGRLLLVEIKDPSKAPSARKLTPKESAFHHQWKGYVDIVETESDCLRLLYEGIYEDR